MGKTCEQLFGNTPIGGFSYGSSSLSSVVPLSSSLSLSPLFILLDKPDLTLQVI